MTGDRLARGARSATFGPAKVSQANWDKIWEPEKPAVVEKTENDTDRNDNKDNNQSS